MSEVRSVEYDAKDAIGALVGVTHYLKTWPDQFAAVIAGRKPWEIRRNDRGFAVGHTLVLQEWDPSIGYYTGRESRWLIGYMLSGPQFGIEAGYSILTLKARL